MTTLADLKIFAITNTLRSCQLFTGLPPADLAAIAAKPLRERVDFRPVQRQPCDTAREQPQRKLGDEKPGSEAHQGGFGRVLADACFHFGHRLHAPGTLRRFRCFHTLTSRGCGESSGPNGTVSPPPLQRNASGLRIFQQLLIGKRIKHVHWKDMPAEWLPRRGKQFGCGMAVIPLGDGVVGIRAIMDALLEIGFDSPTTLEVADLDNVKRSAERLLSWAR